MATKLLERARAGDVTIINLMTQWKSRRALIKKQVLLNELWMSSDYMGKDKACGEIIRCRNISPLDDGTVQSIVSNLKYERHQRVLSYFK